MIEYLSNIEQNKVWKPIPPKTKEYFSSSIPLKPQSTNEIFDDFINNILPYPSGISILDFGVLSKVQGLLQVQSQNY